MNVKLRERVLSHLPKKPVWASSFKATRSAQLIYDPGNPANCVTP
ncbi:hypothetical protein [Stenotrophomonas sp. ZAC14D2_NAIMI4_7]|nr:hypothetical protein [Stenotrophomonas sp. ZAC14D2_NAIMI4_7]